MNNVQLYKNSQDLQKNDSIYAIENFLKFLKWKNAKNVVLDIGSGDGHTLCEILLPKITKKIEKTIGIDISNNMVVSSNKEYGNEKTFFKQMDIATTNIPVEFYEKFDHIFSFFCLHWVIKQRVAFNNIYEMLKNDGYIFLTYLAKNPIFEIYEKMAKMDKWKLYTINYKEYVSPYHNSSNPAEAVKDLMEKIGFHVEICDAVKRSYTFPNIKILFDSVKAVNPFLSAIPEEKHAEYFQDYEKIMRELNTVKIEKTNNNDEETIECFYHLLIVVALKKNKDNNNR